MSTGYWFLDSVAGWRESQVSSHAAARLAKTTSDGDLTLEPLPGMAQLFQGTAPRVMVSRHDAAWSTLQNQIACPVSFAPGPCSRELFVLDAMDGRIATLGLASGEIKLLHGIGGTGDAARQFKHPRGLAVLPGGEIAVCDTENHRVQIFTVYPHALIQLWGRDDAQSGSGVREFKWPWSIACDARGIVYVADRGNKRIQRLRQDGSPAGEMGSTVLQDPTDLAVSPAGDVAVVDAGRNVVIFPGGQRHALTIDEIPSPLCVAFDDASGLFVGTATGLVYKIVLDRKTLEGYVLVGFGVSGLADPVVNLKWLKGYGLFGIMRESANDNRQRIWQMDAAGSCALEGSFETNPLDSGIENCVWHRVQLNASAPAGASILVESSTAEVAEAGGPPSEFSDYVQCVLAGYDNADCLVQSPPGQLMRLRITLRSNGVSSPSVHWIKAFFPRDSYLRYLPAVFQQDPESRSFLERFLSIFQASFDDLDRRIDQFRMLFDPMSVPKEFLPWLSGWLALTVDPSWTEAQRRTMLKKAVADDLRRGTPAGLAQAIHDYVGPEMQATILENFRLRRWPALSSETSLAGGLRLWSRDIYQRLQVEAYSRVGSFRLTNAPQPAMEPLDWGANRFTVFFRSDPYRADEIEKRVAQVVEREKPAHTVATLYPVFSRFRVGVQATLGVDTYIGQVSNLVLNRKDADGSTVPGRLSRLGYDSILGCSPAGRNLLRLGSPVRPRVGTSTRLL